MMAGGCPCGGFPSRPRNNGRITVKIQINECYYCSYRELVLLLQEIAVVASKEMQP